MHGAETWTVRRVGQKCLESFEVWCWGMIEKISWMDRVKNEVLRRVEEKHVLLTINRSKAYWIGHILHRHCLLKHIVEGKMGGGTEVTGRQ